MMARAIAGAGAAKVYIAGRRAEVLDAAAASIGAPPGVVVPVVCDVTSQDSIASLVARVEGDVGYLNLLLCNSGIAGPQTSAPVVRLCFDRLLFWQRRWEGEGWKNCLALFLSLVVCSWRGRRGDLPRALRRR